MKIIFKNLAHLIGSSFYILEFLLIFFPFYYYFLLLLYFVVFLFDEGLLSLLNWEENRFARITTQAFDSILHLYYYFFYFLSITISLVYLLMAGGGDYLVSKVDKRSNINSNQNQTHKDGKTINDKNSNSRGDTYPNSKTQFSKEEDTLLHPPQNTNPDPNLKRITTKSFSSIFSSFCGGLFGKSILSVGFNSFHIPKQHSRKREPLKKMLATLFLFFIIIVANIQGNYLIRKVFPSHMALEMFFGVMGWIYMELIYANIYSYKRSEGVEMYIGWPICYGVMKSVFWGYILMVERESNAL